MIPTAGWRNSKRYQFMNNHTKKPGHPVNHRFAFIIPVYNHQDTIDKVIEQVKVFKFPIFVVNDGSTDQTSLKLKSIQGITVIDHPENRGKGAALKSGFQAISNTADWAITLDADGQHDPQDTAKLISAIGGNERSIVVGVRKGMDGKHVPWTSRFGRGFSNFWVFVSGGPRLQDSQSGFRIYPVPETHFLKTKGQRYQFEVEVLVKAKWVGIPVVEAPVSVHYEPGAKRISHFKPLKDFMRNSIAFTRLITQRILIPSPLRRRINTSSSRSSQK